MRTLDLEYIKTLHDPFLDKIASQGLFFYSKIEFILFAASIITFFGWLIFRFYLLRKIDNYEIDPGGIFARFFGLLHGLFWFVLLAFLLHFFILDIKNSASNYLEPDISRGKLAFIYRSAYTLKVPGTRKFNYQLNLPERRDYVKYYLPEFSGSGQLGRVVGLPNETIEIDLKQRILRVNGQEKEFHFSVSKSLTGDLAILRWTVPKKTVLILPNFIDKVVYNRLATLESDRALARYYNQLLMVRIEDLIGKVVYIW